MIKIKGSIESVIFYNPENGYAVCEVASDGEVMTMTGSMPNIAVGENIVASGSWVTHGEYGDQFKVEYIERVMPTTEKEIEKYLSSGIIPYVGKITAKRIVETFGADALDVIENDHERLLEIKGLTPSKVQTIYETYLEQIGVRQIVIYFQKFNLSPSYAARAYKLFGPGTLQIIESNPYVLQEFIDGVTFDKSDEIAISLGFQPEAQVRIKSGIKTTLKNISYTRGHTYVPMSMLITSSCSLLGVDQDYIMTGISQLISDGEIINESHDDFDAVYLKSYYDAECNVSKRLKEMSGVCFDVDEKFIDKLISETDDEIELDEIQRDAVICAFQNAALVITGGPGTGKTTIINTIIKAMEKNGSTVMLAAPTGRAAKRMSEVCNFEAKTIHRLLEIRVDSDVSDGYFAKNSDNPLECDVLIIDEMSMVDIMLMNSLLDAIPKGTRLIMVGDVDQLPSVGAGNVLKDIIDSEIIECIKLKEIFRQAKESMIVVNAHRINHGQKPFLNDTDNDFFFVHRDYPEQLPNTIADLCIRRLPEYYGLDSISQIQVLTPTRKTSIGVGHLNNILQSCLNPSSPDKAEHLTRRCIFREGDKVMQSKNNYQIHWHRGDENGVGIFNGDCGFITQINKIDGKIQVLFDDKYVDYDFSMLDEIELAYAITVHKSQGSEFDAVVMPMFPAPRLLMTRNLLYTAVTRAKSLVVLVGLEDVMDSYVANGNVRNRFSGLKDKLKIF